jgi:hypothetical protein
MAGHDLKGVAVVAVYPSVQSHSNGIQQGGLARTGRPGNGKQARFPEGALVETDFVAAFQGIEVLKTDA